jgi:methyltransferase OMS1
MFDLLPLELMRQGNVLEISCGTGRNIKFMDFSSVNSITFVDSSKQMLEQAIHTFDTTVAIKDQERVNASFIHADGRNLASFSSDKYDVVIDTFGVCSVDPISGPTCSGGLVNQMDSDDVSTDCGVVAYLNELSRVCSPNGKILLLEHGKSEYNFINNILNKFQTNHFAEWGCWWNRNIDDIIEKSNIDVVCHRKYLFGTFHHIIARPKSSK